VITIRNALDDAGFSNIPIMSYAIKYSSAFYGPFRDAADSTPQFGDRKQYQMDPANRMEALREAESDVNEGADFLIVKPVVSYVDIIRDVATNFTVAVVAENVSGEYLMVKGGAIDGRVHANAIVMDEMLSMN